MTHVREGHHSSNKKFLPVAKSLSHEAVLAGFDMF